MLGGGVVQKKKKRGGGGGGTVTGGGGGGRVTPLYPGVNNGPVRVVSTNGVPIITSERAYRGANYTDWNEMLGYPANQLTSEYWFPLYDSSGIAQTFLSIGNAQ